MFHTALYIVLTAVFCFLVFGLGSVSNRARQAEEALKLQVEENTRLLDIMAQAGITVRRRLPPGTTAEEAAQEI